MTKTRGKRIRLLLVDDHPIVREGIKSALSTRKSIVIVGEAASGEQAITEAARLEPDVILMDINLPGMSGLEAARRIRKSTPAAKILALTMHQNKEYILEMSQLGARGYVFKDSPPSELHKAIEAVYEGNVFFSPRASEQLLQAYVKAEEGTRGRASLDLSAREKHVLRFIAEGLRTKQIAQQMGITGRTVETYRRRLMTKLKVHSVAGLTKIAIARGIVAIK